ncbi:MAG: signal peptidase [Herbinix sp.]|jgi:signal peptidase I|nr:signal peptidase [Herbinix sp.]
MKNEQICSMVKDLTPIYYSNQTSAFTKETVDEHLSQCEECNVYYKAFQQNKMAATEEIAKEKTNFFAKAAVRMRNRKRKQFMLITGLMLAFFICWNSTFKNTIMVSSSMEPTIGMSQHCLINKLAYTFQKPQSGDIVYHWADDISGYDMNRIVGVPGDTILIENGVLYVDNEVFEEYKGKIVKTNSSVESYSITLNEGEYFVMGDNVENSYDSRLYGAILEDDIQGKFMLKYKWRNWFVQSEIRSTDDVEGNEE